ncbi:hypothetical protein RJT34_28869 [Clitoria ternatea]|uniref:Uncharacterized protein n=1 Tax=Clitoria ternatea TaxID=43366 RepID=A0AAN9FI73_CLITE
MINTYFASHQFFEPFTLFRDLYRGKTSPFAPNSHSFTVLVKGCSVCGATREGLEVHGVVVKNGFCLDLYVATALVDMYVKFGEERGSMLINISFRRRDPPSLTDSLLTESTLHICSESLIQ